MLQLVHTLFGLSKNPQYLQYLHNQIPPIARHPAPHDAVLMGYDFHLSPHGPQLIEVNTNAGGLWLASQTQDCNAAIFQNKLANRLVSMFKQEFALWTQQAGRKLSHVALIDQNPTSQFLYPEMQAYAQLLQHHGINTFILDPSELTLTSTGLKYQDTPIDMLYNRHCDFYLASPEMAEIRQAWLENQVCLTPNPHIYALLGDKRRMIDWSTPEVQQALLLTPEQHQLLVKTIPVTRPLASMNLQNLWQQRRHWVFKPDTSYASRGVYLGKKLTQGKLAELNPNRTLVQEYVAPSITQLEQQEFKTDFRLFVYQHQTLALTARLYQGQVTNLRTEGGGFARVKLVAT